MTYLSGAWLAQRFGIDPLKVDAMRRAGALHAVRNGTGEWKYPSWQFEADGRTKPAVRRLLAAAHEQRLAELELDELLDRRVGLVGGERVRDRLLNGGADRVIDGIRRAAA
jgi:hypothetical protein